MPYGVEIIVNEDALKLLGDPQPFIDGLFLEMAKFICGKRSGQDPKSSPLNRHFVKTNESRYGFAPLSPKYAKRKVREFGNLPILVRTGALRDEAGGSAVVSGGRNFAEITMTVPKYGEYHIEGTPKMPARDWTKAIADDTKAITDEATKIAQASLDGIAVRPATKRVVP